MSKHFFRKIFFPPYARICEGIFAIINILLWRAIHYRPTRKTMHWSAVPNDIREEVYRQATIETAQFVTKEMPFIEPVLSSRDLLAFALDKVTLDGLYLEFGVFGGSSISFIASQKKGVYIHGFDSFHGLPEQWMSAPRGMYSTRGVPPPVPENVKLHVGLFDQTLPKILVDYPDQPVAFLHADADIYSSTKTIFAFLGNRITAGTIIVFDEYFNYPGWQAHEYKAFAEFVETQCVSFKYLSYASRGYSVAVMITGKSEAPKEGTR